MVTKGQTDVFASFKFDKLLAEMGTIGQTDAFALNFPSTSIIFQNITMINIFHVTIRH